MTSQCYPNTATRRTFEAEGVKLVVPDAVADKFIRYTVQRGKGLEYSYQVANQWDILPDLPVMPCALEVFSVEYYDVKTEEWKRTSRGYSCHGLWDCFVEYLLGQRKYPAPSYMDRRMQIAPRLFAPSPNEEAKIKIDFRKSDDLKHAYREAGASDIFPSWPSAVQFISNALTVKPSDYLYTIVKTWYRIAYATQGWPPAEDGNGNGNGPIHHHIPPIAEDSKWIWLIAAGVIVLAMSD